MGSRYYAKSEKNKYFSEYYFKREEEDKKMYVTLKGQIKDIMTEADKNKTVRNSIVHRPLVIMARSLIKIVCRMAARFLTLLNEKDGEEGKNV